MSKSVYKRKFSQRLNDPENVLSSIKLIIFLKMKLYEDIKSETLLARTCSWSRI